MLRLIDILASDAPCAATPGMRNLILTCEQRAKTRFRATLSDGTDAVVILPRGTVVRPGTRLVADSGDLVEVVAASEQVYRVIARADSIDQAFDLLRAAYHLGNRHVRIELRPGLLKLERDPVLRDLLQRLDLDVTSTFEPFDPEPGAYGGGHRHDTDADGGAIGEALSRDAHAMPPHASDTVS
ncbi:MAG: urease accessory protein UreE [Burkholderiaceae bacterium]